MSDLPVDKGNFAMSVTGPIPADQLGATLAHEHLWCDISVHSGHPQNRLQDVDVVSEEIRAIREFGGSTIVELTCIGIGRNPVKLREISQRSGVQILSGIAFYDAPTVPDWVRSADNEAIASFFESHLTEGENGVCAGLIGEIVSHNEPIENVDTYHLTPLEERIFEAAAIAQGRVPVAISTHAYGAAGPAQLDVLENAGADLSRVIIGHCDVHFPNDPHLDMDYYLRILQRGAICEFDFIGWHEPLMDDLRAQRIAALVNLGFGNQILLSTDTCRTTQWSAFGGRGYAYLWTNFLPRLRDAGVPDDAIHQMLIDNPRRIFAGASQMEVSPS